MRCLCNVGSLCVCVLMGWIACRNFSEQRCSKGGSILHHVQGCQIYVTIRAAS